MILEKGFGAVWKDVFFSKNLKNLQNQRVVWKVDPKLGNNSSSHVLLMFLDCRSLQRVYSQSLRGVIVSGDGGFPSIHWTSFMVEIQQKER